MGIHHDYKSKRGERAMAKQEKRESKHADNTDKKEEEKLVKELKKAGPVSYTHLTLPTTLQV